MTKLLSEEISVVKEKFNSNEQMLILLLMKEAIEKDMLTEEDLKVYLKNNLDALEDEVFAFYKIDKLMFINKLSLLEVSSLAAFATNYFLNEIDLYSYIEE